MIISKGIEVLVSQAVVGASEDLTGCELGVLTRWRDAA